MNTCVNFLEKTVAEFPDKIAVIDENGSITFSQLKSKALGIAKAISNNKKNQPIGVFLPKGIGCIESFMGSLYSGNFYVPIDVKSPKERLLRVLENLAPFVIISNSKQLPFLSEVLGSSSVRIINIDTVESSTEELNYHNGTIDTDPIYCIYTSGSTGTPKGVLVPHRGVIDYINWAIETYQIDSHEVIGNQAPFYFDNSTLDIYLMLRTGATMVIIPEMYFAFPAKLINYLNEKQVNFIFWVPSIMTNINTLNIFKDIKPKFLNKILFAGEVMPVKTLNYWIESIPLALYSNLYGPTEITVDCTYYTVERKFSNDESLPIGFPCINTDILILNDKDLIAEVDEVGELCVRGSSLALGYWNDFEKTDKAFVQNPLNKSYYEKIYRTGDLVKTNAFKEIIYIGRKDSQIKHMGYRIELGEIENYVQSIDGIAISCVLYNDVLKQITLFYVLKDSKLQKEKILIDLSQKLPKYMIPSKMIELNDMPYNANGKIDRIILKNQYFK